MEVSVVIRTYNEERWISHCLKAIFSQSFSDFEVIIVDNNSSDSTVAVARRFPISRVITIDKFLPGKAINLGINASKGKFIACLSAHCIPVNQNWLSNLCKSLKSCSSAAGVYGRQVPMSFTSDADKRDLVMTFGKDKRIQIKDYFFHNANSFIRRDVWDLFPFDEEATNIEDRIWAKQVVNAGYKIVYEPDAAVFHHHGLHHHDSSSARARGIATILNKLDGDDVSSLPKSMRPEVAVCAAVFLVQDEFGLSQLEERLLRRAIRDATDASLVDEIFVLSYVEYSFLDATVRWIDRGCQLYRNENLSVESVLSRALTQIESCDVYPDVILYCNHHYAFRPPNLFDQIITEMLTKGFYSVFPSYLDYGHFWVKDSELGCVPLESSMQSRSERVPFMRALYGLGSAISSVEVRAGKIAGKKVGIFPVDSYMYTLNARDIDSEKIIYKILGD